MLYIPSAQITCLYRNHASCYSLEDNIQKILILVGTPISIGLLRYPHDNGTFSDSSSVSPFVTCQILFIFLQVLQ